MKQFQIFRYIRQWWWLIALCSVIGGMFFYMRMAGTQTYRAESMISYTGKDAEEGLNPDGSKINAEEIRSSEVIFAALSELGSSETVDDIRSRLDVKEVIPEDVATIRKAANSDGLEYEYNPVDYIVTYTTAKDSSSNEAMSVLDAVLDSYLNLYGRKYVNLMKIPYNFSSLQNLDYDYIEYAEVLNNFVSGNRDYLIKASGFWPQFRSTATGCSFSDLLEETNVIYDVYIPSLYAQILKNHVTNDGEVLQLKYQHRIEDNNLKIANYKVLLSDTEEMIAVFTNKNLENMEYHWESGSNDAVTSSVDGTNAARVGGDSYVLHQVYDFSKDKNDSHYEEITYDKLLDRYIDCKSHIAELENDNDYCNYVLSAYQGVQQESGSKYVPAVESLISTILDRLRELDGRMTNTAAEHSENEAAKKVASASTINTYATVNVKLYLIIALAVFFIGGCVGVIAIGRGLDFVDYIFYVDHTTNLPNRMRCDQCINSYTESGLPSQFACVIVNLTNINDINRIVGRDGGNQVMRMFASFLQSGATKQDFVGYNGGIQFMCFFPNYDNDRTLQFCDHLRREVEDFNVSHDGVEIRYSLAYAIKPQGSATTIRELISSSLSKLRTHPITNADEPAGPAGDKREDRAGNAQRPADAPAPEGSKA